jgi:diguanylate cyclase (GGDEF) domain
VLRAGGGWRWIEATASNWLDDPAVEGVIVNYRDVTERKLMELRLQHGVLHDALTGLPNRLLLSDRLSQAIKRSQRHPDYHFAVIFLDLDRFKFINDSFGHPVGDRYLVTVATRLYRCLRAIDTCARMGGDEFVILLDDIASVDQVISVAERILQQLDRPLEVSGHLLHSSASMGIVFGSAEYNDPAEVLRDADIAMYRAKAAGKSRYVVFQPAMREAAQARLALEHDLRRAVTLREFVVYYQPIVNIHSGKLIGFEALVRWQHPVHGLLSPAAFLNIAEEIGLGTAIGWQVVELVCQQLAEWRQTLSANDLSIHVNLSARQFMVPDLYARLVQVLEQYNIPPQSIKLELTENTLMEYSQEAAAVLAQLRNYGIQIVLDDFGVGYSSLSYLIQLPIDQIKIDRNFIIQIDQNHHSQAIVNAIVNLARGLHLEVVAEGLETVEQVERMRMVGCDYGQGYLLGQPLPTEEASQFLQRAMM